jgi:hypothetical protein
MTSGCPLVPTAARQPRRISDSGGYGVPLMGFASHRRNLDEWADRKGREGIAAYWAETNPTSIDALPGVAE